MGWFNTITSGLGSTVNWISKNSGTIATVASTVGKVAGLLILTEDEKELMNIVAQDDVADLQLNYNKANEYLIQLAKSTAPTSTLEVGSGPHTRETGVTQSATLTGIWTQPAEVDVNGNPLVNTVQDITKFLHQHNMPTSLKIGGRMQDTAQFIGQSIFGNTAGQTLDDGSNLVQAPTFNIANDDKSCIITGCMSYYPIALGQAQDPSQDVAGLHSALHIKASTTREFRVAQAMERRNRCFSADISHSVSDGPGWLVTLQVDWTSLQIANLAWPGIQSYYRNPANGNFKIMSNQQQGNLQIIKIQAGPGLSPYQVRSSLTAAVASAIKSLTTPSMYMGQSPISTIETQLPTIEITNSVLTSGPTSARGNHIDKIANGTPSSIHHTPSRTQNVMIRDSNREIANQNPLAVRKDYRGSSDGGDWTEVGPHVNGNAKQTDMRLNTQGTHRGDWH